MQEKFFVPTAKGVFVNTVANNVNNFARDTGYGVRLKKCVNI
jgi:hypothetical protein